MQRYVRRYAAALADVALEHKQSEAVARGLAAVSDLYKSSADLRNFLASPAVDATAKRGLVEKLSAPLALRPELRNFLHLLVDNRRTQLLEEISAAFRSEVTSRLGIAQASVTSARELSAGEKKQLNETLEKLTGKKVEAAYALDASLLGGAVVQIGSTVYDGSVRSQLNRLREQLETE